MFVELVEGHLRDGILRKFYDYPEPLPVGFVPEVGDPIYLPLPDEGCYPLQKLRLAHGVGDLGYHYPGPPLYGLNPRPGPYQDVPSAGAIRIPYPLQAVYYPSGREVGPLYVTHDPIYIYLGVLYEGHQSVHHLGEVVGGDVGRHPHGYPRTSVAEQVREPARQDLGLLPRPVVVRNEVHGVLIYVRQHLHGDRGEPGLGVPHGSGGVPVYGTEVPLPVH